VPGGGAVGEGLLAAGSEGAAGQFAAQIRRGAGDAAQLAALAEQVREGAQQPAGIGVGGVVGDAFGGGVLHKASGVHHREPVAEFQQQRQVMRDEDDAEAELVAQPQDLVQDLALHHHVQRGGGLVHDDHVGVQRQRHGDHHALPHAAGQLVWMAAGAVRVDADFREQLPGAGGAFGCGHGGPVGAEHIGELPADGGHRVEGVHRGLEDHGQPGPAEGAQRLALQRGQVGDGAVPAVEGDPAGGQAGRGVQHPADGVGQGGLAAAGLPGDAEQFAAAQGEGDIADGVHRPVPVVVDADPLHGQHSVGGVGGTGVGAGRGALGIHRVACPSPAPAFRPRCRPARSRGSRISSSPKLISDSAAPSSAIQMPGGTNHHQEPLVSASAFCA
jgi:hypothetical protein